VNKKQSAGQQVPAVGATFFIRKKFAPDFAFNSRVINETKALAAVPGTRTNTQDNGLRGSACVEGMLKAKSGAIVSRRRGQVKADYSRSYPQIQPQATLRSVIIVGYSVGNFPC